MKIAIDLTSLYGRKRTGVEMYAIDLYKALLSTGHKIVPIFHVENEIDSNPDAVIIERTFRLLLENTRLTKFIKRVDADMVIFPIFPPPLDIYGGRAKIVPVIHDLTFKKFRATQNFAAKYYYTPKTYVSLKHSDAIITISETVKKELFEVTTLPVYNCGENISSEFAECLNNVSVEYLKKFDLERSKYIISVSTLEPRKNFKYLLKVIKPILREKNMKLVLVGRKGWGKDKELLCLINDMSDIIVFTEYVTHECLVSLYHYAHAFALLSIYEGFGRTPFEAVACGCQRIILSDIPIFRETFNNHALFLPLDAESSCISSLMDGSIPLVDRDFKIPFNVLENRVPLFLKDIECWQNRNRK